MCVCGSAVSRAADVSYAGLQQSVVTGLAVTQDLEPMATDVVPSRRLAAATPATFSFATEARSSTPDMDRSRSYASADPFASTRVVLPLLVLDLNPSRPSGLRPLTGRSVGARPSLPLARPESR